MPVFYEQVKVFNRTTGTKRERELEVIFDGQRHRIPVGFSYIPKITVPYAKNQNVVMGSEDAIDPTEYDSLVSVVADDPSKQRDDLSPVEESSELSRVKLKDIVGDGVEILVQGKVIPRAFDSMVAIPGGDGLHVSKD